MYIKKEMNIVNTETSNCFTHVVDGDHRLTLETKNTKIFRNMLNIMLS